MYFFIAIYIKNKRPIKAFNSISLYKKLKNKPPLVHHLRALGFTVYFFIAEKNRVKLVRFTPQAKKDILINYNGKIIYYIWLSNK